MKRILCAALCVALVACVAVAAMIHPDPSPLMLGARDGLALAIVSFASVDTYANQPAILVGNGEVVSRSITLLSGQNCIRGTVLGKIAVNAGAVTVNAGVLTGTGNGTLTLATPAYGAGVQEGDYTLVAVEKTTDSAEFLVRRPDGTIDGRAIVGTAYDGQIKFTVNDGSTDYDQTSVWTVPVSIADTAATKYKKSASAATDGSQTPAVILAEDCDASGGDKVTVAYFHATVDENALTYGTGHTAATCREPLRDVGLHLQSSVV